MEEPGDNPNSLPADDQPAGPATTQSQGPATPWQFRPSSSNDDLSNPNADPTSSAISQSSVEPITWTASEFIAHQKTAGWYALLGLATIVVAGLIYLVTRDAISTGVVVFAALVLAFYAGRKPRELTYRLDTSGITVGSKSYNYDSFKSFSVVDEGAFSSIMLLPLKRFMPSLSIYYDPKDEAKITNMLADRLPVAMHKLDAVDSFMRRIRF